VTSRKRPPAVPGRDGGPEPSTATDAKARKKKPPGGPTGGPSPPPAAPSMVLVDGQLVTVNELLFERKNPYSRRREITLLKDVLFYLDKIDRDMTDLKSRKGNTPDFYVVAQEHMTTAAVEALGIAQDTAELTVSPRVAKQKWLRDYKRAVEEAFAAELNRRRELAERWYYSDIRKVADSKNSRSVARSRARKFPTPT
jgi:hypothetical protein